MHIQVFSIENIFCLVVQMSGIPGFITVVNDKSYRPETDTK